MMVLSILMAFDASAQTTGDSRVFTTMQDTSGIYIRVKRALIKSGFTVRDDMDPTTLTTNLSIVKHLGYTILRAEINNDTVVISGFYCNKKFDLKGDEIEPGTYKKIRYFKGGWGWDILKNIGNEISNTGLSYSK